MRLHIDTDMGVDDGLALVAASRLPGVEIAAVSTVFGNVGLPVATRNALLFRSLLGACWPVLEGAAAPSEGEVRDATHVHGDDGLGGATKSFDTIALGEAAALAGFRPEPGPVVLLGIGPATNIPALIERYGGAVERIVLMSGAVFDRGNITETAEFNAICDPAALRAVLACGVPTTLVPLDICRKVQLARQTVQAYPASPLMRLVIESHMPYMDRYRGWEGIDGCLPHDTVALLVAAWPERFFTITGRVEVDREGRTTFAAEPGATTQVAMGGDLAWVRRFLQTL